jgi:hypothetical protein
MREINMEEIRQVRSEEVRVKFLPDMKKRVDRIAKLHGTPTATWCHQVVAAAVVDFERKMQIQNKMQDQLTSAVMDLLGPEIAKAVEDDGIISAGVTKVTDAAGE